MRRRSPHDWLRIGLVKDIPASGASAGNCKRFRCVEIRSAAEAGESQGLNGPQEYFQKDFKFSCPVKRPFGEFLRDVTVLGLEFMALPQTKVSAR